VVAGALMPRVGAPILPAVTLVFVLHQFLVEPERASA